MITITNANNLSEQIVLNGDISSQAKSWQIVYDFCLQCGMDSKSELSGLQEVIQFITVRLKEDQQQPPQEPKL